VDKQPSTLKEFVEAIREGLVCGRCGRYIGSLSLERYVPPPYPIAVGKASDDEVDALVAFEWQMLQRLRSGNFTLRHPQRDGECVTVREWLRRGDEDDEGAGDEDP
jgi:hypothetical protein